ncbi:Asp-tRNA(Asn)/Glu-tRNA(Gln) amidotransferase subunit GatC [Patescibacteria group bacterium]|nr:Asp-tRNA(Asn)/Glu-tRNA(Gln) amidotransferase subunit GatC [Patescibacteria group bacterium]MBU1931579.1 Asp-tRNA(Asn)/Glu-tRNA(Gln) amidotransferase subunit GatC [Patescibacteria group bacterium]
MAEKTQLTKKQVLHIAKLANLQLTSQEVVKFQKQLADVLDYMEVLNELDTAKVKPTSQVTGLENVFRQDKVEKSLSQKEALSGAKAKQEAYFKTKAIFE